MPAEKDQPRCGYAIVLVNRQGYEGHCTQYPSGVLQLDAAKLRVPDATREDGFRRQPTHARSFSPSVAYEVRWLRVKGTEAGAGEA